MFYRSVLFVLVVVILLGQLALSGYQSRLEKKIDHNFITQEERHQELLQSLKTLANAVRKSQDYGPAMLGRKEGFDI